MLDGVADLAHHSGELVTEDRAVLEAGGHAVKRKEVGPADCRSVNLDQRVGIGDDPSVFDFFDAHVARAGEHDRFHAGCSISTR